MTQDTSAFSIIASVHCQSSEHLVCHQGKALGERPGGEKRMREQKGQGDSQRPPLVTTTPRGVFLAVAGVLLTWGGDRIVVGERHSVAMAIIGRELADRGCAPVRA